VITWNLARFAETLLPLIADGADKALEAANESIARFDGHYHTAYLAGLRQKLGLMREMEGDEELGADLLTRMAENKADFTLTFRALSEAASDPDRDVEARALFSDPASFDAWAARWRERLSHEHQSAEQRRTSMRAVNPMFIPRNHRVEAAIADAQAGRLDKFHELVAVLVRPYDDQPEFADYSKAPEVHEEVQQTFCGT
jgi:serine/tyrosine/threonine adenylyltransferase